MVDVAIHTRASESRCPYCHSVVAAREAAWTCARCSSVHHRECFREHGQCSVHGCEARAGVVQPAPVRAAASRSRWLVASLVAVVLGVILGGVLASRRSKHPAVADASSVATPEPVRAQAPPRIAQRPAPVEAPEEPPSTSTQRNERARAPRWRTTGVGFIDDGHVAAFNENGDYDVYDVGLEFGMTHSGEAKHHGVGFAKIVASERRALVGTPFDTSSPDLSLVDIHDYRTHPHTIGRTRRPAGEAWRIAALDADAKYAFVVGARGRIEAWHLDEDDECIGTVEGGDGISALAVPPRAPEVCAGTIGGEVRFRSLAGRPARTFATGRGEVLALQYRGDWACMVGATTGEETTVFCINAVDGRIAETVSVPFMAHAIVIEGSRAIAGSAQGDLALIDTFAGTATELPEKFVMERAAFSANGRLVVAASRGPGPMIVIDFERREVKQRIQVE